MPKAKDHPTIFRGWSIRSILAGSKTQMRRVVNPQPPGDVCSVTWDDMGGDWIGTVGSRGDPTSRIRWSATCPYGKPGDILWVREAWNGYALPGWYDKGKWLHELPSRLRIPEVTHFMQYRADRSAYRVDPTEMWSKGWKDDVPLEKANHEFYEEPPRWKPSIHMFKWMSRLRLQVEGVRVERLQEISEDDAISEGVKPVIRQSTSTYGGDTISAVIAFKERWNETYGRGDWEKNPWVWVVSFSKIEE